MGKIFVQHTGSAWDFSGSIAAAASVNSGSFNTQGYNRLVGSIYTSGSLTSGCGLRILQSIDGGTNWDITNSYAPSTIGASSYDIEVVGNKMLISASPGTNDVAAFRALFYLQPIGLGTVGLKVGSIDIGNVIVDEISKIQQQVSASISGGSVALLAGVNDAGIFHVGTGTCAMGAVTSIQGQVSASISGGSAALLAGANDVGLVHIGAGASDVGIVHVGTGTCAIGDVTNIQNQVSASVSGGSVAMLAGANDVGLVHVGTGASVIGYVNLATGASDFGIVHAGTGACDIGIVHVGTGTCAIGDVTNIQNRVSASVSGGSVALLAGANDFGLAHIGTGTCIIGFVQLASGASDFGLAHIGTGASDIGVVHVGTGTCIMGMVQLATGTSSIGEVTQAAGSNFHVVLETSTSSIGVISAASVTSAPWKSVWSASGTLAGSDAGIGEVVSGCADVTGFGRLTGILYLSASLAAASGLRVQQSGNNGTNWDLLSACLPAAAGTSSFGYEIFGNAVSITVRAGSSSVDYRSYWFARQGQ